MSGIEVVGLVLAVIPLVISGLEHYAEGAEKIRAIWNYSKEFRIVAMKLTAEEVVFQYHLKILLSESVDDDLQQRLIHSVNSKEWKSPQVERAIRARLQDSYTSYLDHVHCIEMALEKLRDRLHIGQDGMVPFDSATSFRQAFKKFRFGLKKTAYLDLIQEIHDYNLHVDTLINQTRTLQALKKKVQRSPDFSKARLDAINIYECFRKGLRASCNATHRVSLCLKEHASDKPKISSNDDIFRVVFHHDGTRSKQKALAWSLEEAEIRSFVRSHGSECSDASSNLSKAGVRFTLAGDTVQQASNVETLQEIHNLCDSVQQLRDQKMGSCIGYLMSSAVQQRHAIYRPETQLMGQDPLAVRTLGTILTGHTISARERRFTSADARRLAVPLAMGILKFYDTPWLPEKWNKENVTVMLRDGKILSEHPFISQSLQISSPVIDKTDDGTTKETIIAAIIRNQTIFALGIILIELCMGKSIEELHLPEELNPDGSKNELSDFRTATRLWQTQEISEKFGKRWSDVVKCCIHCTFDEDQESLHSPAFRKAIYNRVLLELEEDYRQFFNL